MKALRIVVGALLVSTAVHYTDNWLSIDDSAPRSGLLPENPWLMALAWHLVLGLFSVSGTTTPPPRPDTRPAP